MEGCPNTVSPRMTEPTLRKRGSFRQDYAGSTLRDHYGLTRPVSVFSRSLQAIASSIEDRSRRARRAPCFAARTSSLCARILNIGFAAIESDQFASPKCQPCFREQPEEVPCSSTSGDPSISSRARFRALDEHATAPHLPSAPRRASRCSCPEAPGSPFASK